MCRLTTLLILFALSVLPALAFSAVMPATSGSPVGTLQSTPASSTCNGLDDLNCGDFANSQAATAHLQQCGDEDRLDRDNDGLACE